uniref:Uncharacterized protein n=1 Tax=uncultured prokaryote TaxID=198431 RepID=A0A0H5QFK1_9ZZZZ|nr:hypothetical protein [uncultured prokaryote]
MQYGDQRSLGQTGWQSLHVSLVWTWEHGWTGRLVGRRSAQSVWLECDPGVLTADALSELVGDELERRGHLMPRADF